MCFDGTPLFAGKPQRRERCALRTPADQSKQTSRSVPSKTRKFSFSLIVIKQPAASSYSSLAMSAATT
jgi:hypothetical protein